MKLVKISDTIWEIPVTEKEGMRVPARIIGTKAIVDAMDAGVFEQVTNVACLPGIRRYAYCMPDGHWGYGFPIGGVAAFSAEEGVISPGGIGFDINCGMRLIKTNLTLDEVRPKLETLLNLLFTRVPAGVGAQGSVRPSAGELEEVMVRGAQWAIGKGYGWREDADRIEVRGAIPGADPAKVSEHAVKRGIHQIGSLGSGNHYLEIQVVSDIHNADLAARFGLDVPQQIVVMVHCGSRGFGHQVATDYLSVFDRAMKKYGITVRDRQLACAPFSSPEGRDYFSAMNAAANMAFANRQVIMHRIREVFEEVFGKSAEALGMDLLYDVAHNIARLERYTVGDREEVLVVHRKGATRSFGPGSLELPPEFRETGQPVVVGGSMETGSYLLVGTAGAMAETFGSTLHGSGRTMSRAAARKKTRGRDLQDKMRRNGIIVKSASMSGLAEEAGEAYKNISDVVDAVDRAGISKKVVRLRPIGNIKG